jgi:hypothetical protein
MFHVEVESNQWVVYLSVGIALCFMGLVGLLLLPLVGVRLLRVAAWLLRPLAPIGRSIRIMLMFTPLRTPLHRYLYVGHHLAVRP